MVGAGSEDRPSLNFARLEAVRRESREIRQLSQEAIARAQQTRAQVRWGRSSRQLLHDSEFARLVARQKTMAVIEQAKGILMAQQRCGPEEAFDLLRRVSQRANVKLHVLAAQMVATMASGSDEGNVIPIALGAAEYRRAGRRSPSRWSS